MAARRSPDPALCLLCSAGLAIACGSGSTAAPGAQLSAAARPAHSAAHGPASRSDPDAEQVEWAASTAAPALEGEPDGELAVLEAACGRGDAVLRAVALRLAERQARGRPALDPSEVVFLLRAAGSPRVWPRTWSLFGARLDAAEVAPRIARFRADSHEQAPLSCGVARANGADGKIVLAAVAAPDLAALSPVPTTVRSGSWVDVQAELHVAAQNAKLVVLGPRGAPHSVPTSLSDGVLRARFNADAPGPWLLQVVASDDSGPRPVLEALVYADDAPPTSFAPEPAPGETEATDGDVSDTLVRMVNGARREERIAPLSRDARLDVIAAAHAAAMRRAQRVGHDVGDGDPEQRVLDAGLGPRRTGENVAHARTAARAHRTLWASPSHRANLLDERFTSLGSGAASDADGSIWVTETFAEFR